MTAYRQQIHGLIVPPRDEQGPGVWWLQQSVATEYGRWNAVFQQWLFYSGPWICAGVALAILAAWHYLRLRRVHAAAPIPRCDRWAGRLACLGRSMLAVGFLWMLAYLWFTPAVVRTAENTYQTQIADLQNPQGTMDELNKTMEEIRTGQSWRNELYPVWKRP
jgi:hypothetical protein